MTHRRYQGSRRGALGPPALVVHGRASTPNELDNPQQFEGWPVRPIQPSSGVSRHLERGANPMVVRCSAQDVAGTMRDVPPRRDLVTRVVRREQNGKLPAGQFVATEVIAHWRQGDDRCF
jgi:hypothetical protein